MFLLILQLAYFCSLGFSLPLPQTRDSTYPPFLVNTVFPLCDGDCDNIPWYRTTQAPQDGEGRDEPKTTTLTSTTNAPTTTMTTIATTTVTTTTPMSSTTISTTADPQTSTVATCNQNGGCPSFPAYKVVSDEDDAEASYSSTVFVPPYTTSTPPLSSSALTTTNPETTAPELITTVATKTTTPSPEPSTATQSTTTSTETTTTATTVILTAYPETPLFAVDAAKTTGGSDE